MRNASSYYGYESLPDSPDIPDMAEEPEGAIYLTDPDYEELEMDLLTYLQNKRRKECDAGICDCLVHDDPPPLETGVSRELIKVTVAVTGICFCAGAFLVLMWP
ncbi:hypothetical protein ASPSYDRAFT_132653 [Aspergillus sydowii CBS 593.65]|uniref:Uncharacterized protein n=1 Tax=Aspergillus sydowii CBS 593.65 TaxID=1036612 RepID=A0A1L9TI27_9EURO|nr:uncharacterized protein ASPSYDRAFT_132653 [Aspergillus sydowii CBS 593.65]OJJ59086.1 hypothetical protein ASPSYDRAFT_132653 [Aspergillus sydowii CBS 593.65]